MKLITEQYDSVEYITEGKGQDKKFFIEGIFMQADTLNRNKRIYPMKTLAAAVKKYVAEQVHTGRAVGELNHPAGPSINLDKVSHRITDLHFEGNNVLGKAAILNTPMGQIVKGLLEGGVKLGVSSRGMGSIERVGNTHDSVREDYCLATVDIVQDPSAPSAFVNGIMEGKEYFVDDNGEYSVLTHAIRKRMHNTPKRRLAEQQIKEWSNFLNAIRI